MTTINTGATRTTVGKVWHVEPEDGVLAEHLVQDIAFAAITWESGWTECAACLGSNEHGGAVFWRGLGEAAVRFETLLDSRLVDPAGAGLLNPAEPVTVWPTPAAFEASGVECDTCAQAATEAAMTDEPVTVWPTPAAALTLVADIDAVHLVQDMLVAAITWESGWTECAACLSRLVDPAGAGLLNPAEPVTVWPTPAAFEAAGVECDTCAQAATEAAVTVKASQRALAKSLSREWDADGRRLLP